MGISVFWKMNEQGMKLSLFKNHGLQINIRYCKIVVLSINITDIVYMQSTYQLPKESMYYILNILQVSFCLVFDFLFLRESFNKRSCFFPFILNLKIMSIDPLKQRFCVKKAAWPFYFERCLAGFLYTPDQTKLV